MSAATRFLARVYGLFLLIAGLAMAIRASDVMAAAVALVHDPAATLVLALVCLGSGLAALVGHSVWSGGAVPVCVTLIGWLLTVRGAVLLFLPPGDLALLADAALSPGLIAWAGAICIGLGAFLAYAGFRARPILSAND